MKRYFSPIKPPATEPDYFWTRSKVAYWELDGDSMREARKDGTTGQTNYQSVEGFIRDGYPELTESAALALLDEPWKVAGEGWRLMEGHEVPGNDDEYYWKSKKEWHKTSNRAQTVTYYVSGFPDEIMAYRRRLPVNNKRYFIRTDRSDIYYIWHSNDKQETVFDDGKTSQCWFKLDVFCPEFKEVTLEQALANISTATKSTSTTNTNMSDKTVTSGKFKVGDRVKTRGNAIKTVVKVDETFVYTSENDGWYPGNLELVSPALPTKFQVDTRGLEGVKRMLAGINKLKKPFTRNEGWWTNGNSFIQFHEDNDITSTAAPYDVKQFPVVSLDEAITILTTKPEPRVVEVKLNDSYTAIVTQGKDTVKVGCQEIPISAIKELARKVEEVGK